MDKHILPKFKIFNVQKDALPKITAIYTAVKELIVTKKFNA